LIELLVVIAIIGILAAMVFPVFARARESARKAVCLSNVKNISLAIQMYLGDNNDTFWPTEHRQEVSDFWKVVNNRGGDPDNWWCYIFEMNQGANPYLKIPVLLDEYVKNRDVFLCPSARLVAGPGWIYGAPNWLQSLRDTLDQWNQGVSNFDPCPAWQAYPQGWGGELTDSVAQGKSAWEFGETDVRINKAFRQSTGFSLDLRDRKLGTWNDVASTPWGGCGNPSAVDEAPMAFYYAYGDVCGANCTNISNCWLDYMPWTESDVPTENEMPRLARHLGGSNIGFLDGHAAWFPARTIVDKGLSHEWETMKIDWGTLSKCYTDPLTPGQWLW
jgi:prepilin-type processing-associated H-X9-DG protein